MGICWKIKFLFIKWNMFQAIYQFSATSEKELSLEVGDYVVVRQVSFLMSTFEAEISLEI